MSTTLINARLGNSEHPMDGMPHRIRDDRHDIFIPLPALLAMMMVVYA